MYGLNNPASVNYIANLQDRIRVAAELATQAAMLNISIEELLENIATA